MDKHVNTLREVLAYLQEMDQAEYDALHEVDWDALQDMQEVCQRIASRIAALDGASFVAAAKVLPEEPEEPEELTQEVINPMAAVNAVIACDPECLGC